MRSLHCGAHLMESFFVLCVLISVESLVVKPVVPNHCRYLCKETVGCCFCLYMPSDLSCHISTHQSSGRSGTYPSGNTSCPEDVNMDNYSICEPRSIFKTPSPEAMIQDTACLLQPCNISSHTKKNPVDESACVLYTKENITKVGMKLIPLPLRVKPGMKITVYGGYTAGLEDSQLSITLNPKKPENWMHWFHIRPKWEMKRVALSVGFTTPDYYEGGFPISDQNHFTLAVELTSNSTKIYVNTVVVKTMALIPEIKEVFLRRWDIVYLLMVRKTDKVCYGMDAGIPRS